MTAAQQDFYLHLPSNASVGTYHDNSPSFKVVLPTVYEMHSNEWEVALVGFLYPHTLVNMAGPIDEELKAFRRQGVFKARISEARRPKHYKDDQKYPDALWVTLHIPQGNCQTAGHLLKGMPQAFRNEFDDVVAEFQFNFDDDNKLLMVTIKFFSALGLNSWMQKMLEEPFKPINVSDFLFHHLPEYMADDKRLVLLGNDWTLLAGSNKADELRQNPTRRYCNHRAHGPGDWVACTPFCLSNHLHLFRHCQFSRGGGRAKPTCCG